MPDSTPQPSTRRERLARVVVIGTSGCGKTTFARRLAAILDSTPIELDALYWDPNWTPKPAAEFDRLNEAAVAQDRWVLDGNYSSARERVWNRATAVVWLNYSFVTVFGRALRRTVRRAFTREVLFAGNRESLRLSFFSKDSILVWVIRTHRRRGQTYAALRASGQYAPLHWLVFKAPREAETFLRDLQGAV